ncbi:MAG: CHASE2 domain-containing protein [Desulforhopalus sp.]
MKKYSLFHLLQPTPLKVGIVCLSLSCLLYSFINDNLPGIIREGDGRITDTMFKLRGPQDSSGQVVIVDIDEKSLQQYGQWPWPRNTLAELLNTIAATEPVAIGIDLIFAEKDRSSPSEIFARYQHLLAGCDSLESFLESMNLQHDFDHDKLLGDSIRSSGSVLGYMFLFREDFLKGQAARPFTSVKVTFNESNLTYGDLNLISAYRAVTNISEISTGVTSGYANIFPDASGMVRRSPLFVLLDGQPYPSLPFEMVRSASGDDIVQLHPDSIESGLYHPLKGVTFGRKFVQTGTAGQLYVNYRGPYNTFLYVSASDILDGTQTEILRNKYILVGSSATGILDRYPTPFSARLPGIEIHANVVDNLISGDAMASWAPLPIDITYPVLILGGLSITLALTYLGSMLGSIVAAATFLIVIGGTYLFGFLNQRLLGLSFILFSLCFIFTSVALYHYFLEGRRRLFLKQAFSRYVSASVVNELLKNPERFAQQIETREVSVLFCDIRNFTTLSEKMSPADLGRFLNRYLSLMTDVILDHKGMVDKYIGDGIMAVWGTPLDNGQHALNAVEAALKMADAIEQSSSVLQLNNQPIEIGIGINTGHVSAGNFGSSKRFDYTVLGDNVNLASRLEGLTKFYHCPILISQNTRDQLDADFPCRFIDKVMVKGRHTPVNLFEPLASGRADFPASEVQADYSRALDYYRQRRFEESLAAFTLLHSSQPELLYKLYIDRSSSFLKQPPESGWNGAHNHT